MVLQFAATIYLQSMLRVKLFPMLNVLYFCISTFQSRCAVPSRVGICSSLISWFLRMLLRYFRNDAKMIQSASIITCITLFLYSKCPVFLLYSLHFTIFSPSSLITFMSAKIATSIDMMFFYSLAQTVMSSSLLGMVLLVCTCRFNNTVPLPSKLVSTKCDTHPY